MSSIRLDPQNGVNPSINTCFYCGEDKNEIILFGMLSTSQREAMHCGAEAPKNVCIDKEPCEKCKAFMKQGIIFVGVADGCSKNKPRTIGRYCVIKDSAVEKMGFIPEMLDHIITSRLAFIEESAWDMLGLPTEPINYSSNI